MIRIRRVERLILEHLVQIFEKAKVLMAAISMHLFLFRHGESARAETDSMHPLQQRRMEPSTTIAVHKSIERC